MPFRGNHPRGGPHQPTADWGRPAPVERGRMHAITLPHRFGPEPPERNPGRVAPPPGRFAGLGPRRYRRPDEGILEDVALALTDDPLVDAGGIELTVQGGEVHLAGEVPDRMQRRRAEDVAWSVRGVREVQCQIRVRPMPRDDALSDKRPPRVPQIGLPPWLQ